MAHKELQSLEVGWTLGGVEKNWGKEVPNNFVHNDLLLCLEENLRNQ